MTAGAPAEPPGERYCPTCEQTYAGGERCPADGTRLVRIASSTDTLIGRELDGRYTIVHKLGQGGMGSVYRGTQHSVGRDVAIKVVTPSLVSDAMVVKRFLREAKLASRLSHPNAVSVLDFGQTDDGLFFLVMELVEGRTLDQVLAADRVLAPARIVRIGTQICDALEGAHALQIVHRDLKPANVMVMATGRDLVKVLDFGLAKSLTPDAGKTTMTNAGVLLGTPAFMPPELVTGQICDERADLYSLGCVLYLAASGEYPFVAGSVHELISMHASEPPTPLDRVPPGLSAVIHRMLAKHPGDRFQTAAEAREALESSLSSDVERPDPTLIAGPATILGWTRDMVAQPDTDRDLRTTMPALIGLQSVAPTAKPARSKLPLIVGAIVLVAAAAAIAFSLTRNSDPPPPPPAPLPSAPPPAPAPPPPSPPPAAAPDAVLDDHKAPDPVQPPAPTPTPKPKAKPKPATPPPKPKPVILNPGAF
jgi:serine/threonine-protein kinase